MATEERTPSKRKRDIVPENEDDKLEIDVNLPEPPSKKAKRKEKKQAKKPAATEKKDGQSDRENTESNEKKPAAKDDTSAEKKRSEHGIWIGNLPFNVNKEALRQFLKDQGGIDEQDITRVHMPAGPKVHNKGFAYVDFTSEAVLQIALALSEKLLNGRAVLIKNAKSYEGRPAKSATTAAAEKDGKAAVNGKEPSKRVFVGNLSFDVTKDDLAEHFAQAGEVADVFMATFQDSGKCKGFAWVRFAELEAAQAAVKGYILQEDSDDEDEDEDEEEDQEDKSAGKKKSKAKKMARRHYINRIQGRQIRCEFAEDAETRYKKRFGKGADRDAKYAQSKNDSAASEDAITEVDSTGAAAPVKKRQDRNLSKDERQEMRRKRHDARMIAPGKALAGAQRATGAIVASAGTKTTFD